MSTTCHFLNMLRGYWFYHKWFSSPFLPFYFILFFFCFCPRRCNLILFVESYWKLEILWKFESHKGLNTCFFWLARYIMSDFHIFKRSITNIYLKNIPSLSSILSRRCCCCVVSHVLFNQNNTYTHRHKRERKKWNIYWLSLFCHHAYSHTFVCAVTHAIRFLVI